MEDQRVERLLAQLFKIPLAAISDELSMSDVEAWDSLQHMELILSVEQTFQIQLAFDDIVAMQSVGQIKQVLRQKGVIR